MKLTHIILVVASIVVAILNSSCATSTNYGGGGGYSAKRPVEGSPGQVAQSKVDFKLFTLEVTPSVGQASFHGRPPVLMGGRTGCSLQYGGRPPMMPSPRYGRSQGCNQPRPMMLPQETRRPSCPSRFDYQRQQQRPRYQEPRQTNCRQPGYQQLQPGYSGQQRPPLPPGSRVINGVLFSDSRPRQPGYPGGRRIESPW